MPFMQPFGFVLLAACVASAASDRGLMNIDIAVAASKDIAALTSINVTAAQAQAPNPDIAAGMVRTAQIAPNAASEWAAGDLQQVYFPWYNQIGCFQDGTSFTAARRLARRLGVSRGEGPTSWGDRATAISLPLLLQPWPHPTSNEKNSHTVVATIDCTRLFPSYRSQYTHLNEQHSSEFRHKGVFLPFLLPTPAPHWVHPHHSRQQA
jgi:hypothetical protein